jgi:uncharacterized protein (TIGR02594 family)
MDPLNLAAQQIGMNETDQRVALQEYMSNGGVNLDPAVTAWCAAFVNASLAQSGQQGTGSNMARSFLDWGQAVDEPQRGDLAVFSRGDPNGPYGHVGFFDGYNPDGTLRILGGNQGANGEVSYSSYGTDNLLGFRRGETGGPSQNALAAPQGQMQDQMQGQPQNALAQQPPAPQISMMDVNAFMRPQNGYTPQPLQYQRRA